MKINIFEPARKEVLICNFVVIFQRMAAKVQKEYQATKGRKEFIAMGQEFEYLHEKMAHIKLLVQEYDKTRVITN